MDKPIDSSDRALHSLWVSDLDPLFWPPSRIGAESAWVTHVPFAHWIVTVHQPRSIVELGTHNGVSYSAFCEAVQRARLDCRCLAIDTWRGDEHSGFYGEEVYTDLRRFHDPRYASFSVLVRCTFDAALRYVPDNSIDLLHIDGLHSYDAVRHDFEQWRPKLSERAVVLFHDTNVREREFGVSRLWAELSTQYPSFEFLHGHGLGILEVGSSCSDAVRALGRLSGSAANTIRERFSFLGERWQLEMQAVLAEAEHSNQIKQLDKLRREQTMRADAVESELSRTTAETEKAVKQVAILRRALETANQHARNVERLLECARRDTEEISNLLTVSDAKLRAIQSSTSWRMTWPIRRVAGRMPLPLRRMMRGAAYLSWWTITLQLPQKLRYRRDVLRQVAGQSRSIDHVNERAGERIDEKVKQIAKPSARDEPVDIIVCAHDALVSLRTCIESVFRYTMPPYRIIVVDDGSGPETASYLDELAREQDFLLLRNSEALGYTRAANMGLRAVTAPWVVLLNSDTIVTPNWLDNMWAHGARDPAIGVIGPLSNTASWQSVPRIFKRIDWAENQLPRDVTVEEMGRLVAEAAVGAVPLPFINGFCYMIRAKTLKSVGMFDEAIFGGGYGEENDYSIRVRNAGWSLAVATDAYVYHAQSMSYSQERRLALAKRADELLALKHDPQRNIFPHVGLCRDSLAMASIRARLTGALLRRQLLEQGQVKFEGKRIAFLLPVAEVGGGGNVVLQESLALQRMGVDVTLLNLEVLQRALTHVPEMESLQVRTFPTTESLGVHLSEEHGRYDAIVATLYRSVYWLPLRADCRLGYYIQDFEPLFFAESDPQYRAALESYTYSDRIRLFTKTRWNQMEVSCRTGQHAVLVGPSVDVATFAPGPPRGSNEPLRIVAMVRPSTPRRAPERTVAVLEKLVAALGEKITVDIFGTGDAQLELEGLSRPWAKNAGKLDRKLLAALLSKTDVFLDCSDYQAMGLTALEAMLSGCAVVAPQRGGGNDFIRTGVNGILVDTTDEAACVDAVLRLVNDAMLLKAIRTRGIEDANQYLPEQAALRLMEVMFDA